LLAARKVLADHFEQRPQLEGLLRVRSETLIEGRIETADSWMPRLLPGEVRYRGRIHEQPITAHEGHRIDLTIQHDGYCQGDLAAKRQRNAALISAALSEDPDSPYLHFQAGVEDEIAQRWDSACEHFAVAIRLNGDRITPYSHPLAYRYVHALSRAGRINEALDFGLRARAQWPDSSDVHFAFGNVCLDASLLDPASALEVWLPAAETAWKQCLEIGESDAHEGHISGRGSYLAAQNLVVLYSGLGQNEFASAYRELAGVRPAGSNSLRYAL
jgi:tetratricopeptide (TPR) repeat protein